MASILVAMLNTLDSSPAGLPSRYDIEGAEGPSKVTVKTVDSGWEMYSVKVESLERIRLGGVKLGDA